MFEQITQRFSGILSGIARKRITEKNIREALREIRVALLEADVAFEVIKTFLKRVEEKALGEDVLKGVDPGHQFIELVYREMAQLMGPVDPSIEFDKKGPTVILMAGLQGSGKTTTCGKLALLLKEKHKRRPLLVAADVQRPAAIEQLRTLGAQIDVPVHSEPGQKPPKICKNAVREARRLGRDTVILDTAGRLHIDEDMMREVSEVARVTKPHEVFLVCDAMVGQDAVKSAREFNEQLELTGVILTKLDGDARGGAALSVKEVTGKTVKFVGVGEKLEGTLDPFDPAGMASRILGFGDVRQLVEKAREHVDQEEAQKMQSELLEGSFTLQSFLNQLKVVKKMQKGMGGLKGMLGMLPGMGAALGDMDIDDNELNQIEAIIQSMTAKERARPEILNTSRRNRIARGCGLERMDVDDLIRQFNGMKKMMDQVTRKGGKGAFGKVKDMVSARKKLADVGGMMQSMMQATQGAEPGQPKARKGTAVLRPSRDQLKKKRKQERKNRRKARRR